MNRADKKKWAAARTLTDLGELTAQYIEGKLTGCPGHPCRLDPETHGLEPYLTALCRGGYVTDCSQPGYDGPGYGGHWAQRAAVSGVAAPAVADRLIRTAQAAGLEVADGKTGTLVTLWNGRPHTGFGGRMSRRDLKCVWPGISASAFREIEAAEQVAIAAPDYGPGQRLWGVLDKAVR